MSRMLDALKTLEARRPGAAVPNPAIGPIMPEAAWRPSLSLVVELTGETEPAELAAQEPRSENSIAPMPRIVEPTISQSTAPASQPPTTSPPCASCCLPTTLDVSDHYLELAARIGEQVASSYCNVLLFVSPDRAWENGFSLTYMAQAFVLQSPGEVLLVDGDLRGRRLSKSIGLSGPGLGEVMLGAAHWPDVINRTKTSGIDFVGCGNRQLPTLERTEFGWNALRPQYRAVLIGVALAGQPDTDWLAARCDGVYLVISRPNTKRQAASAAVSRLRDCGANVLGCIVLDD
jgi:Mrp family chromosome partitioning ATPase